VVEIPNISSSSSIGVRRRGSVPERFHDELVVAGREHSSLHGHQQRHTPQSPAVVWFCVGADGAGDGQQGRGRGTGDLAPMAV